VELFDFVRVARTAVSTTRRVVTASIVGIGNVGDDASAERVDNCEVAQPLGLFAVPVLTPQTEGVVARLADRPFVLFVLDKGRTAQACEDGGAKLYGVGPDNAAAIVYIRATGAIEVTSVTNTNVTLTAGGTGTVRFQDGSQAFVKGNAYSTALNTYLDAAKVLNTAIGVFATAVGAGTPLFPAVATAATTLNTAIGVCNAAIDVFKASAASSWLSTKVFGQ
jgi:hypothetical protein